MPSINTQDASPDPANQALLTVKLDNVRNMVHILKSIHFKESLTIATFSANDKGMKVTVEEMKCVQANAFLPKELFREFSLKEDVEFCINLSVLLECLSIFGSGSTKSGPTSALKMCYKNVGSHLTLLLEESGILTDCSIRTQNAEEILDFDFNRQKVLHKIFFKPECLKDILADLDVTSKDVQFLLSPDPPYFRVSSSGIAGTSYVEIPQDSEVFELFQCSETSHFCYQIALMKMAVKPLGIAQRVSFRVAEGGLLCMVFLIKIDENKETYVEFYCVPDVESDEDE